MSTAPDRAAGARQGILTRLTRARSRHTGLHVWRGMATLLTAGLVLSVGLIGIESVVYLSPGAKTVTLVLLGLVIGAGLAWGIVRPVLVPLSLHVMARRIETAHGGLNQHLTNTLQLWDQRDQSGSSRELIDAAIEQAEEATRSIDFSAAVDGTPAKTAARRFALALVVGLLALQLFPGSSIEALSRLAHPTERYIRPRETQLTVTPGDTALIVGDSLILRADIEGIVPLKALLLSREEADRPWTSIEVPIRENRAAHGIPSVRRSFVYRWQVHDAESETHTILAKVRPVVLTLTTRYHYPAYTGLPDRTDHEGGDIAALKGTAVSLHIRANKPLAEAWLAFDSGTRLSASVSRDSVHAAFTINEPARFTIGLRDTADVTNANPVTYRILTLEDEIPSIVLLRPGADSELGERMEVPLLIEATDDFGVARVEIVYRLNGESEPKIVPIPLERPGQRELTLATVWDLSRSDLLPGDRVTYRIRAYDINTLTGPGIGETPEVVVRFPSLHEIHEAARHTQDETVEQLEEMADQNRRLQEKMQNVRREILKNDEVTWENQAEIRDALQQHEDLKKQIEQNVRDLDEARERMERSGLLSPETLEKLQQIRQLMESLNSPELDQLSQELRDAVTEVDPEMIREALERLTSEQEAFQENLDRTIALLKRVRDEQMLDALASRLRELARDQKEIHREISSTSRSPEELVEQQTVLRREAEHLEDTLAEAARTIDAPDQQLQNFSESFNLEQIPDRSGQSERDMKAGKRERARKGTEKLSQDLDRMATELEAIQAAYRQTRKDELLEDLASVFRDALNLSRSQEQMAAKSPGKRSDHEALARQQARDLNATARLARRIREASRKTFLVPPRARLGLQNAMEQMEKSVGNLQRKLGRRAGMDAREAMAGLNSAAMAIREAMAAVRSAASSTGLDEMLRQLSAASDRQGDLNAQTEGELGQGRPGGSQPGGLSGLSAEQQAIRQMLDDLREKYGSQAGDALGDLSKISEEMGDIARQLARKQLNDRTIDRQRRILSRLLDAQHALRQRGFSNDREAKAGTTFAYRGPGTLPADLGESDNPLRSLLRKALRQGYPKEYRTLIRRYFDRLIEDATSGTVAP